MTLSQLVASASRLALVGLAKNTGKTETLALLLRELEAGGRRLGVTSVGRDGEEHDVIDARIDKPRVLLPAGSLLATTDSLLRASGLPHETLRETGVRTPLGRVLIARLRGPGAVEVAGPSAAADVRAVSDAMLELGAEQVLIDGAVDRRAASSPEVSDGIVMSTGAVLGADIGEVVAHTADAVELVRLQAIDANTEEGALLRSIVAPSRGLGVDALVGPGEPVMLEPRFALVADAGQIERLLEAHPGARWLVVSGALPEAFLRGLAQATRRRGRQLTVVAADSTRVFLAERGVAWYRRQGVEIRVLRAIALKALTVNPVAPRSHRFDSAQLRALLAEAVPDLPIFDVRDTG